MKKILTYVGICLPLLVFGGCQTQNKKTEAETKFEQELMGLYSQVRSMTTQAQTRSADGEFVPLTEAELEAIFAEAVRVAEANGIAELVSASGYYQGEMPDFSAMDKYELLQWLGANGSPAMYETMLSLGEGNVNAKSVIENPRLLPNEKIGAVVGLSLIPNGGNTSLAPPSTDSCLNTYDIAVDACDRALVSTIGIALAAYAFTIVITAGMGAPAGGGLFAITGLGAYWVWTDCGGTARKNLRNCLGL